MSYEILKNTVHLSIATERRPKFFMHDAVHDMESFFWVIVYLCLTRQSGGDIRREELIPSNFPERIATPGSQ